MPLFTIFDEATDHKAHSKGLDCEKILGAGFVKVAALVDDISEGFEFVCIGKSTSLDVDSRNYEDSVIINRHYNMGTYK